MQLANSFLGGAQHSWSNQDYRLRTDLADVWYGLHKDHWCRAFGYCSCPRIPSVYLYRFPWSSGECVVLHHSAHPGACTLCCKTWQCGKTPNLWISWEYFRIHAQGRIIELHVLHCTSHIYKNTRCSWIRILFPSIGDIKADKRCEAPSLNPFYLRGGLELIICANGLLSGLHPKPGWGKKILTSRLVDGNPRFGRDDTDSEKWCDFHLNWRPWRW